MNQRRLYGFLEYKNYFPRYVYISVYANKKKIYSLTVGLKLNEVLKLNKRTKRFFEQIWRYILLGYFNYIINILVKVKAFESYQSKYAYKHLIFFQNKIIVFPFYIRLFTQPDDVSVYEIRASDGLLLNMSNCRYIAFILIAIHT